MQRVAREGERWRLREQRTDGLQDFWWQVRSGNGDIAVNLMDCMCRKMRGHSSMLQPHMIAVKLGRMGRLSLA